MELEERLSYLENVRDWQSLVEELEKGIVSRRQTPQGASSISSWGACSRRSFSRGEGAQALPRRVQAQPRAHREPECGPQRLLGPRQAQHGPEAPRAGAQGHGDSPRCGALLVELGDVLSDQGDYEQAAATLRSSPRRERRQEPGRQRLPRGRAGRRRGTARTASRPAPPRQRRERRAGEGARAPARRARRAALLRPTTPRACSLGPTRPTRPTSRSLLSTRGSSPSRVAPTRWSRAQRQVLQHATGASRAGPWRSPSARAGSLATRTSRWAPASSRRRCGSIPRTRARSFPSGGLRQEGGRLGLACSTSPRRLRRAPRTATARSCSPRPATIAWRQLGNLIRAAPVVRAAQRRLAGAPAAARLRGPDWREPEARCEARDRCGRTAPARAPRRRPPTPAATRPRRPTADVAPVAPPREVTRGAASPQPLRPSRRRLSPLAPPPAARPAAPSSTKRRSPSSGNWPRSKKRPSATTSTSRRSCSSPALVGDAGREGLALLARPPISTSPSSPTRPRP